MDAQRALIIWSRSGRSVRTADVLIVVGWGSPCTKRSCTCRNQANTSSRIYISMTVFNKMVKVQRNRQRRKTENLKKKEKCDTTFPRTLWNGCWLLSRWICFGLTPFVSPFLTNILPCLSIIKLRFLTEHRTWPQTGQNAEVNGIPLLYPDCLLYNYYPVLSINACHHVFVTQLAMYNKRPEKYEASTESQNWTESIWLAYTVKRRF